MNYQKILIEKGGGEHNQIDLDGLECPKYIPVFLNFDRSQPPLGTAEITKEESGIYADLTLFDIGFDFSSLYPAVGVICHERNDNKILKAELREMSLSIGKNADTEILRIGDQLAKAM